MNVMLKQGRITFCVAFADKIIPPEVKTFNRFGKRFILAKVFYTAKSKTIDTANNIVNEIMPKINTKDVILNILKNPPKSIFIVVIPLNESTRLNYFTAIPLFRQRTAMKFKKWKKR